MSRHVTEPIVSIVMPTFNRLEFLPATVESVLMQTMPQWELIIADDGSNRETLDYLENLTRDERIRLVRLHHSGNAGAARNAAIAEARATLLAFLDSDDLWAPNKLERQIAALRANSECRWSYTAFVMVDASGTPLSSERSRPWTPHSGEIFAQTVRTTASIRPSSVLASTAFVREAGAFDEAIDCSEDYDLWLRLALRSPVCVVDEPLIQRSAAFEQSEKASRRPPPRARLFAAQARGTARRRAAPLLVEERSRNALGLAAALTAHGERWRSAVAVCKSLPLGWRFPHWWYGAAKAFARACIGARRRAPKPPSSGAH